MPDTTGDVERFYYVDETSTKPFSRTMEILRENVRMQSGLIIPQGVISLSYEYDTNDFDVPDGLVLPTHEEVFKHESLRRKHELPEPNRGIRVRNIMDLSDDVLRFVASSLTSPVQVYVADDIESDELLLVESIKSAYEPRGPRSDDDGTTGIGFYL